MLTEHGHAAEHVNDIGLGNASDRALWCYAIEHDAVLVTKDEDFSNMLLLSSNSPIVVWVRVGNTRRQPLLEWFEALIDRIVELVAAKTGLSSCVESVPLRVCWQAHHEYAAPPNRCRPSARGYGSHARPSMEPPESIPRLIWYAT
jgi:predicted nuclease of predicted toxin-antitoxin system